MKRAFFSTALIFVLTVFAAAQKQKAGPVDSESKANKASKTNGGLVLESGTRLEGQLQSTIDAKNARVGDQVVLKTTKDIKQNGRTVVPKGSSLIGRVTDVQQRTKENNRSRIGMVFDRLQGGGSSTPINASIVAITNAAASANAANMADADIFGSSATSGGASTSSGGGGLLGGTGGVVGGATSTVGGVLNTATQTTGSVVNTAGRAVNGAGSTIGSTTGSVINTVNGIQITNSASASGSAQTGSTLSAAGKNVRIEKGANVQLQLNSAVGGQ